MEVPGCQELRPGTHHTDKVVEKDMEEGVGANALQDGKMTSKSTLQGNMLCWQI